MRILAVGAFVFLCGGCMVGEPPTKSSSGGASGGSPTGPYGPYGFAGTFGGGATVANPSGFAGFQGGVAGFGFQGVAGFGFQGGFAGVAGTVPSATCPVTANQNTLNCLQCANSMCITQLRTCYGAQPNVPGGPCADWRRCFLTRRATCEPSFSAAQACRISNPPPDACKNCDATVRACEMQMCSAQCGVAPVGVGNATASYPVEDYY
jgi:hypothetical protein